MPYSREQIEEMRQNYDDLTMQLWSTEDFSVQEIQKLVQLGMEINGAEWENAQNAERRGNSPAYQAAVREALREIGFPRFMAAIISRTRIIR